MAHDPIQFHQMSNGDDGEMNADQMTNSIDDLYRSKGSHWTNSADSIAWTTCCWSPILVVDAVISWMDWTLPSNVVSMRKMRNCWRPCRPMVSSIQSRRPSTRNLAGLIISVVVVVGRKICRDGE